MGTRVVLSLWGAREAQQASLGGALDALTLVGARAAPTLVGALESWTEPAATKMSWAGPAEELESTCEESAPEPKDNEELMILRSGASATGNNSFSNLVGTGSNKHVVGLDAVIS